MLYDLYQIVPNDNPTVFLALDGNAFTRIPKDKKLEPSKATKLIFDNEQDVQCFMKQFKLNPNKYSIQVFLGNEEVKALAAHVYSHSVAKATFMVGKAKLQEKFGE